MKKMDEIIASAYQIFAKHRPGEYLDACTDCCLSEADAQRLKRTPLKAISADLLGEYNDAARPAILDLAELKYFAPRYLELIAAQQFPTFCIELSLVRFAYFSAKDWTAVEQKLLNDFAFCFFEQYLSRSPNQYSLPLVDILLMFYLGKFDLQALLVHWADRSCSASLRHFANFLDDLRFTNQLHFNTRNAFADASFNSMLTQWINTESTKAKFRARIEKLILEGTTDFTDLELQELSWKYDLLA